DVRVLGDFAVRVNGEPVPQRNWQTRQVRKLFKYLLLERGRKLSREQLMEFLWPEADPRAAAASLRVTLSRLRQALAPAGEEPTGHAPATPGQPLLQTEQGLVWLHEGIVLSIDASIFSDLIERGRAAGEKGDWAAARQALEEAVALYRGDLLPEDLYEDWTAAERERLQLLYLEALVSLAQVYRRTSPPETAMPRAIEVLRRALGVNPYREDIVRELMNALISVGQRDEAVRVFLRYQDTVREEFATAPGAELLNLARSAGHRG
ncbi:MAG: AfsR/SARP family transcriptional regulator, partial [Bacillota bacterium]